MAALHLTKICNYIILIEYANMFLAAYNLGLCDLGACKWIMKKIPGNGISGGTS